MTGMTVKELAEPELMIDNESVRAWHTGLVQGPKCLFTCLIMQLSDAIVEQHRRIDPDGDLQEQLRAQSLADSTVVTLTNLATAEEFHLWQGGEGSLTPRVVDKYDTVDLAPGEYRMRVTVSRPAGSEFEWSRELLVR